MNLEIWKIFTEIKDTDTDIINETVYFEQTT